MVSLPDVLGVPEVCHPCCLFCVLLLFLVDSCSWLLKLFDFWLWASISKNVHCGNLVWQRLRICFYRAVFNLLQQVPCDILGTLFMLFDWLGVSRLYGWVNLNSKPLRSEACGYETQGDFFLPEVPNAQAAKVSAPGPYSACTSLGISFKSSCAFKTMFVIFVQHI